MSGTADKDEENPFNLHTAATHGHLDLVELLLDDDNPQYEKPDDRGRTPLILAAANGHPEVVELLLDFARPHSTNPDAKPLYVNKEAKDGSTALKAALTTDNAGVAEVLLREPGIDIGMGVTPEEEWTPLGAASLAGFLKVARAIVKKLAKDKPEALYEKHRGENAQGTPLYLASDAGHTKVVKLLLKNEYCKKPNYINEKGTGGRTALLAAATNGHADVVELLLRKNARTDLQATDGMSPLKAAIIGGHTNVVKLLFAHHNSQNRVPPTPPEAPPSHEGQQPPQTPPNPPQTPPNPPSSTSQTS